MAAAAEELDVDGIAVRLTSPDRMYFPKLGSHGTKRRLVEYYFAVAGGPMLTALRDRPTHLQRFPDGVDGEQIYQKRIPRHRPDYLQTCRVTFPSGRMADALKVTHPAAIVWAAQMGTITLHPWQVRCPDTEHPDELRIDLDPQPGTGFVEARTVAVDVLRSVLDDLGLVGYPKTSGGRGIHVFLRIATDWDFVEVRRAGIALAREVERRAPDAVTTSWWKEERGARIFIDFNQNARDRTMASAYSVRPTPIATVSMPLTWEELAGADPDDYTMTTVPELVKIRDDPWAGMDDVAQSIAPLLDLAVGGQPDAVGVDDDGLDRAGLGGVDELEELFVDGRFATGEHHHFGFTLGGNERVEHPFTLRRGDGVAVGLVARVGETDRAVQVAVCVDLDQPQAGVLLVVRAQPAVTGTAVAHLGLKPQRKGARFVESC